MEETLPTINLVIYLLTGGTKGKAHHFYAGGHGYTYDINDEGKKKLVKDVPTSVGYFAGNPQKSSTVVQVKDIVTLTVADKHSATEAILEAFFLLLEMFNLRGDLKNICVITPHKELASTLTMQVKDIRHNDKFKFAGEHPSDKVKELLVDIIYKLEWFTTTDRKVVFDFAASAEGGLGIKEAQKQLDLAEVDTIMDFGKLSEVNTIPRKDYENPVIDFNKLVDASRWYFDTENAEEYYRTVDGYRVYGFGKVEPDKGYYGKNTPDVTYSQLYTKKPLELLDKLFEFTKARIENKDGYLSAGDLNNIVSKDMGRLIDRVPGVPTKKKFLLSPFTKQKSKPLLIELISPVLMSYKIREQLKMFDVILEAFLGKDENNVKGYSTFYDITDMIYVKEVNGKGVTKLKLNPAFTQVLPKFQLKVNHHKAKRPVTINLSIGYDLPDRNSFNSVEDPNVKVWCVTDTRNDMGLRYCTIVETEEFVYIHSSAVANLRVLSVGELGRTE